MAKQQKTSTGLSLKGFFRRFHLLIFFVIMTAVLGFSIVYVNETIYNPKDDGYTSTITAGSIDRNTLDRLQSLHTSNEPSQVTLPLGRSNPFAE